MWVSNHCLLIQFLLNEFNAKRKTCLVESFFSNGGHRLHVGDSVLGVWQIVAYMMKSVQGIDTPNKLQ